MVLLRPGRLESRSRYDRPVSGVRLADVLRDHARERPNATALIYEGSHRSFAELDERTNRLAQALLAAGVKAGTRVAHLDQNAPECVELLLATAKIGAAVVPLNWRLAKPELEAILADADPSLLVCGRGYAEAARSLAGRVRVGSTSPMSCPRPRPERSSSDSCARRTGSSRAPLPSGLRMPSSAEHAGPRRPRKRGRRPRTYAAVLEATSRLLDSVSLSELSVARILEAAGVGRTSFYEHFSSKEDVVVKLVRSVSREVADEIEPMFDRGRRSPDQAFAEGIQNLVRIVSRHARLLVAVSEEWPAVAELREIWLAMLADATTRLAATIDRDRAAGIAPAGADSEALAASLLWTVERAFHVATSGADRTLLEPEMLVEPLAAVFVGSIYGRPPAAREAVP